MIQQASCIQHALGTFAVAPRKFRLNQSRATTPFTALNSNHFCYQSSYRVVWGNMFAFRRFAASRNVACNAVKRSYTSCAPLSQLSSLSEPDATLFKSYKLESSAPRNFLDEQLRADVRTMGSTLGQVIIGHDGQEVFDKVETMRNLAKVSRT